MSATWAMATGSTGIAAAVGGNTAPPIMATAKEAIIVHYGRFRIRSTGSTSCEKSVSWLNIVIWVGSEGVRKKHH